MIRNTPLLKAAKNVVIAGSHPGYIDTMEIRCSEKEVVPLVRLAFGERVRSHVTFNGLVKFKSKTCSQTWAVYNPKDGILAIHFPPVSIFREQQGAVI